MASVPKPTLLDAALGYAARGWPVFPCSPANKRPLLKKLRDGDGNEIPNSGGVTQATTDVEQIRGWWAKWPKALIGLGLKGTGLFVVDFDPRVDPDTGEEFTLERLKGELEDQMGCALPPSLAVRTQSGGVHVYLRQPSDGGELIRNRGNLPLHVDVRAEGGYVIVPPSTMSSGAEYRWLRSAADAEPSEAPVALVKILREPKAPAAPKNVGADAPATSSPPPVPAKPRSGGSDLDEAEDEAVRRYTMAALDREVAKARDAVPGTRNATLCACALALGHFVGAGVLTRELAVTSLIMVARQWPDLDKSTDTIERGVDDGARDPRDLSDVRGKARERALSARRWADRGYGSGASDSFRGSAPASDAPSRGGVANDNPQSFRDGTIGDQPAAGGEGEARRPTTAVERARAAKLLHARLARYNRTDLGNAERFRDRYGDDFRFSPALGWLAWDGRRWKMLAVEDKGIPGEVLAAVYKMVRAIRREAWVLKASGLFDAEKNPDGLDRYGYDEKGKERLVSSLLFAWAEKSEANARLRCVAGLVQPWLTVETDAFDRDPLTINVLNGTLRFRKEKGKPGEPNKVAMKLFPHDRRDLITRLCPVIFDKAAKCPTYDRVFAWAQPKSDVQRYLHQWGGLNLTGEMGEQILHFWHGGGGNGKSTIIDAWAHAAGDYSTTVGIETFLDQGVKKSGGNPTPDLARLGGVRMLRTSEPEKGAQLAEALIKLVTGGEPMAVRFLNKGFFDLRPLYKLTISGNHWLGITGTDNGIWRRVKLISWDSRITDEDKDETLPEKLREEASGIFNRLVAGLLDYLRHGLIEPASVTAATAEYRDASDPLGRFLKLCVKPSTGKRVQASLLHSVYEGWCLAAGETAWKIRGFGNALIDKGYRKKQSDGMQWLDIELIRQRSDFVDDEGNARAFSLPDVPDAGATAPPPDPGGVPGGPSSWDGWGDEPA